MPQASPQRPSLISQTPESPDSIARRGGVGWSGLLKQLYPEDYTEVSALLKQTSVCAVTQSRWLGGLLQRLLFPDHPTKCVSLKRCV